MLLEDILARQKALAEGPTLGNLHPDARAQAIARASINPEQLEPDNHDYEDLGVPADAAGADSRPVAPSSIDSTKGQS